METYYRWEEDDKNDKNNLSLNSPHSIIMKKIKEFYEDRDNFNLFISIINGESDLSLRVIDFFVTNYAREKEIIYEIEKNNKKESFMVHYSYKSQLKAYSKKRFDPFCRRERIFFYIHEYNGVIKEPIKTTIGQLNFFKWAIENKIIEYIYNNYNNIEGDINKINKTIKLSKIKKNIISENNKDISLTATKKVNQHNITITVKFN